MLGLPFNSTDPMMLCPGVEPWKIDEGAKAGSGILPFRQPNIVVSSVQANFTKQILSSKARKSDGTSAERSILALEVMTAEWTL